MCIYSFLIKYIFVVSLYPSLLLCEGVHSVHFAEAMSGPILLQSIPDEPPETLVSCGVLVSKCTDHHIMCRKGAGGIGSSVCLRSLVARRSLLIFALVASGSMLSGLPQSSMPTCIPQFSLLLEPSTAVFRVCCGTVIHYHLVVNIYQSIYSP